MSRNGQSDSDWGERAVHWLKSRYVNWPLKAIARDIDEPESVVKAWWNGGRPGREKLQKLAQRFSKDGLVSFVFGAPSREEIEARIEVVLSNVEEIKSYLRARELARRARAMANERRRVVRGEGEEVAVEVRGK